jgi:hypothetical protein
MNNGFLAGIIHRIITLETIIPAQFIILNLRGPFMVVNLCLVIFEAYLGCIVGAIIYSPTPPDFHLLNPFGLLATIAMSIFTPKLNLLLLLVVAFSVAFVIFKWNKLWSIAPFVGFVAIGYFLRLMWKS